MEWAESKIVPVAGDLIMERLGLSDNDRLEIVMNCHIMINCAASVNFDDPLQDALRINYFGCMKMLELAHECKNLDVFTHVSTCYVNCNRPAGLIEEELYDTEMDVDETVRQLMAMNPQEVEQQEKKLIGNFPNTYTFTKNLAEKSLFKKKGNLQCVLFRPSIIASSVAEPFPGWTDSLSAAGGLTLMSSLGLINYIKISSGGSNRLDMVPVDIVSNGIIVATANAGTKLGNELDIYNCGTSVENPITMSEYREIVLKVNKFFSFNKKVFPV
jgi:fatty acyl-CoA reductase